MHHLLFVSVAAVWGCSFILMKKAAPVFGPLSIASLRVLGGGLALGAVCLLWRSRWRPARRDWALLALIVVIGYAWPYSVQPFLVARHGSGFIGMMVGLVPILTIAASVPLLGVRPRPQQVLGVLGGLVFLGLLLRDGIDRAVPLAHLALAVTVPAGYALANTLVRRRFAAAPAPALSAWCLGGALLLIAPLAHGLEAWSAPPSADPQAQTSLAAALGAIAVLGVLGTGLAIAGMYRLIQTRGPLYAGMVTYLIPLGAILLGWLDGEHVSLLQLSSMLGILAMVALVQWPARAVASVREEAGSALPERSPP